MLVLDVDETLIFANEEPIHGTPDFEVYGYHVYRRPHLDGFLRACAAHFELAVWSSASDDYVRAVVDNIFPNDIPLHFVWGRSKARLRRTSGEDGDRWYDPYKHQNYEKPLAKLKKHGWRMEKILILDDTPEKCRQNYGNAIYPDPFEGDHADNDLLLLSQYLPTLADAENVRKIEKRNWRQKVQACGVADC